MRVTVEAELAIADMLSEHGVIPVLITIRERLEYDRQCPVTASVPLNVDQFTGRQFDYEALAAIERQLKLIIDEHAD